MTMFCLVFHVLVFGYPVALLVHEGDHVFHVQLEAHVVLLVIPEAPVQHLRHRVERESVLQVLQDRVLQQAFPHLPEKLLLLAERELAGGERDRLHVLVDDAQPAALVALEHAHGVLERLPRVPPHFITIIRGRAGSCARSSATDTGSPAARSPDIEKDELILI